MFGRYQLIVVNSNSEIVFEGYFQSINRLAKTLVCFSDINLEYSVNDVVLNRHYSAYELKSVFKNEMIIL